MNETSSSCVKNDGSTVNFYTGYSFTKDGGGSQAGESARFTAQSTWIDNTYTHSSLSAVWGSGLTVYLYNAQSRNMLLTSLYLTITYTPGSGGGGQPPRTMHQIRMRIL